MKHTISVLTVTQYNRHKCFCLLIEMIKQQTMKPTEWIIVEGSPTKEECNLNKGLITKMMKKMKKCMPEMKIHYIPNKKMNFAEMLNIGNEKCSGDFIVQMEDDDYYPPTRIEHAVIKLIENPDVEIAGCSSIYMFDFNHCKMYKTPFFGKNHSCNHALAYKKSYLNNNRYVNINEKEFSIETTFLNNFNNEMVQLEPFYTIINSCHNGNTIQRDSIIECWKIEKCVSEIPLHYFPHYMYYKNKYENIFV